MSRVSLTINGRPHTVDADPDCPLLYVLRDTIGLANPRFGCGLGQCGACTVLLDNRAVRSCRIPVSSVGSRPFHRSACTDIGCGWPARRGVRRRH